MRTFGGSLAVEVRRNLLLPLPRIAKRVMDLLIVALGLPAAAMLILLLGLLVRLESSGPVFYGHRRIGRFGTQLSCMEDSYHAEQRGRASAKRPGQRSCASRGMAARTANCDATPRITRVGRFLRKTSLDELPQLWNVPARGDEFGGSEATSSRRKSQAMATTSRFIAA